MWRCLSVCVSVCVSVCEHACLSVWGCLYACVHMSLTAAWIASPFQDCDFARVPVESWKHQVSALSVDSFCSPPPHLSGVTSASRMCGLSPGSPRSPPCFEWCKFRVLVIMGSGGSATDSRCGMHCSCALSLSPSSPLQGMLTSGGARACTDALRNRVSGDQANQTFERKENSAPPSQAQSNGGSCSSWRRSGCIFVRSLIQTDQNARKAH